MGRTVRAAGGLTRPPPPQQPYLRPFAARLRRLREARGLSQEDLALSIGMAQKSICRLEQAREDPRLGTVVRLAGALGVAPATLIGREATLTREERADDDVLCP